MRTFNKILILLAFTAVALPPLASGQPADDQLLTLPAAISEPPAASMSAPAPATPSETLIGLPSEDALDHPAVPSKKPADRESLISLPQEASDIPPSGAQAASTVQEIGQQPVAIAAPAGSSEIVISGQAPAVDAHPAPAANSDFPLFPKDTSSALFMVMKTWECDSYDGRTLLEHAIGVYSKESEDAFSIKGLEALSPFKLTLKESDITLDELLDIVSQKANIDWGVDIAQKVIYLYPAKQQ